MEYLHNNKEQFQDAIELAYEQTGIMTQAIEKDYYVTMLLRLLSENSYTAISFPNIGDMMEKEAPNSIEEFMLLPFSRSEII